jgi:hypothetical protein
MHPVDLIILSCGACPYACILSLFCYILKV